MTTLTLKTAYTRHEDYPADGNPPREFDVVQWKAGVSSVERLDQGFYFTLQDVLDKHGSVAVHAQLSVEDFEGQITWERRPLSLLSVYYGGPGHSARSNWELILVERAWLLGPTGDTLERIAP